MRTRKATERRRAAGEQTRDAILNAAARLSTTEGLEGLSISRLAEEVGMSKGGVYAHFGSKEELQLATIETAREIFAREVFGRAPAEAEGVERLLGVCDAFLSYVERRVFPGGCFFYATAVEASGLGGAVRERLAESHRGWMGALEEMVRAGVERGEIVGRREASELAFQIYATLAAATIWFVLQGDASVLQKAGASIRWLLGVGV